MRRLGFTEKLVHLVMNCITTTSFSIIINGAATSLIQPQRGLRQGCPLSPYLFILCAKVFSNLLMQAEREKLIHGLKFDKQLTVSHLLFVDESLVFTKASVEDCRNLKAIFDCYAAVSRQIFNYEKSLMFCSRKLPVEQITAIKKHLPIEDDV